MQDEDFKLEEMKQRMSPEQREQMAKLVAGEVKRRNRIKAELHNTNKHSKVKNTPLGSKLTSGQVEEMYFELSPELRKMRYNKSSRDNGRSKASSGTNYGNHFIKSVRSHSLRNIQRLKDRLIAMRSSRELALPITNVTLFSGVFTLGLLKLSLAQPTPNLDSSVPDELLMRDQAKTEQSVEGESRGRLNSVNTLTEDQPVVAISPHKEELLVRLDERRTELEHRREELDKREQELLSREGALNSRISELKELTKKVDEQLKAREKNRSERVEQMANVYASMQPKDAATLIEKLDNEIAIKLLEYLPGKRMGQILSLMEQARAVELTKQLSGKNERK